MHGNKKLLSFFVLSLPSRLIFIHQEFLALACLASYIPGSNML